MGVRDRGYASMCLLFWILLGMIESLPFLMGGGFEADYLCWGVQQLTLIEANLENYEWAFSSVDV